MTGRSGFAELPAQVGLGQVGIVLSLEVSRLLFDHSCVASSGCLAYEEFPMLGAPQVVVIVSICGRLHRVRVGQFAR